MILKKLFGSQEEWDHLEEPLIRNAKKLFQSDLSAFYDLLRNQFQKVKSHKSLDVFVEFNIHLESEIQEAAPFISADLNRIFSLVFQWQYYSYIPGFIPLIEICGNRDILRQLKQIIQIKKLHRVLSHLEIYQMKKTIYTLSQRFSDKDTLVLKIEMELSDLDMDWQDDIDI